MYWLREYWFALLLSINKSDLSWKYKTCLVTNTKCRILCEIESQYKTLNVLVYHSFFYQRSCSLKLYFSFSVRVCENMSPPSFSWFLSVETLFIQGLRALARGVFVFVCENCFPQTETDTPRAESSSPRCVCLCLWKALSLLFPSLNHKEVVFLF